MTTDDSSITASQEPTNAPGRAEMPVEAFDGNGLVSKLEILRGDLVEVLFSATRDSVDYRFGTRVSAMTAADDGVDVVGARLELGGHGDARRRLEERDEVRVAVDHLERLRRQDGAGL